MRNCGTGRWSILAALALLLAWSVCRHNDLPRRPLAPKAYTPPASPPPAPAVLPKPGPEDYIQRYLLKAILPPSSRRAFCAYGTYGSDWARDTLHVYVRAFTAEYSMRGDSPVLGAAGYDDVALKAVREGESLRIVAHVRPPGGEGFPRDVRRIFPRKYWHAILIWRRLGR
jgi:hypothetical protein